MSDDKPRQTTKLTPVVSKDKIVTKKKSLGEKFKETFISPDIQDVKHVVFRDVVVPTVQNSIIDILEMLFFNTFRRNRTIYRRDDTTPYSSYYASSGSSYNGRRYNSRSRRDERPREEPPEYDNKKVDYRNVVLIDPKDAKKILDDMYTTIEDYGQASVANLFELLDLVPAHTDYDWGWTNKGELGIRRVTGGYLIDVAEAKYLLDD